MADNLEIITRETLFKVLFKVLSKKGMDKSEIYELTEYVLSFFGFDDYLVDNILTPLDRDIFYYLEECGIFKAESMEINLLKGRQWRIHFWTYRKDNIQKIIETEDNIEIENPEKLYEKIFNEHDEVK
ncbi:MAG: DUF6015 family protein [Thermoplasmata archaeon]|nr:hypothetical protein [Thermoplasmata archaeon]